MSTISISTTLERKVLGTPLYYMAIAVVSIVVFGSIPAFYNSEQGVVWSLHDALHPLIGIVLGPIVGPIVSAAGVLLSNIVTPYTAFNLLSSITYFPMMAFVTGLLTQKKMGWQAALVLAAALHGIYFFAVMSEGVISPRLWLSNVFTVTFAIVIMAVPFIRRWIFKHFHEGQGWRFGVAFYGLLFFGSVVGIQFGWVIEWFFAAKAPTDSWTNMALIIFLERTFFPFVATLIGGWLIKALRRSKIQRPSLAGY